MAEQLYPEWRAVKGHHFVGQAYVEFQTQQAAAPLLSIEMLEKVIWEEIRQAKSVNISMVADLKSDTSSVRLVQLGDYVPQPCGGTHVQKMSDLSELKIISVKVKSNALKIRYSCGE